MHQGIKEGAKMKKIVVLEGDGIGPEITQEAIKVLEKVSQIRKLPIEIEAHLLGGKLIDREGVPINETVIHACQEADAVFLGAVGHPKYNDLPLEQRPEFGLLSLRKALGVFANLRPGLMFDALKAYSPIKANRITQPFDICIVRELTGGIYFGKKTESDDGNTRIDEMAYSKGEIQRIAKIAFEIAQKRSKRLTSVDKANVLTTSRLWRTTVEEVGKAYPDVTIDHLYVDNAAMQMVINPTQFDVILTSNMFGDILSDEMSVITGSIGVLPSASINESQKGLYEPIHGSAPDIAGKGLANPIASILSIAMMFRYSFNDEKAAKLIEEAVTDILNQGYRTADIDEEGTTLVSTREMGDLIIGAIKA